MITYEGYLTQQKLRNMFNKLFVGENWIGKEYHFPKSLRRYDFGYINNVKKYLVEFDGYRHYTDALQFKIDKEKKFKIVKYKNYNGRWSFAVKERHWYGWCYVSYDYGSIKTYETHELALKEVERLKQEIDNKNYEEIL